MRIIDQIPDLRENGKKIDVAKAAQETLIDVTEKVEKPPFCLSFLQGSDLTGILTLGDFSVVAGQAKSRKTFFVTMVVAALLTENDVCDMIRGHLPEGKQGILYIDTEQSDWHAQKAVLRALALAGIKNTPLFKPHKFRDRSTDEKKQIFEYLITITPELGFVVIDGIADFVDSVNDESECKKIADWLMKISKQYHCHIMVVIHENKSSRELRGHLGSILTQKAQAVIGISRDTEDDEMSIVEGRYMRDFSFEEFAIGYDEETNLPTIFHEYEIKEKKGKKTGYRNSGRKKRWEDFTEKAHAKYVTEIFNKVRDIFGEKLRPSEITQNVEDYYPPEYLKNDLSKLPGYLVGIGILEKNEEADKAKRRYWLSGKAKILSESSPF